MKMKSANAWQQVVAHVRACYSARNVVWQLLAVALTYALVVSGFDWWWFTHTRDALLQSWLFPAAVVGGLLPLALPIMLFFAGRGGAHARERVAAFAVAKAALLGLLISSFYKIFTGRVQPPFTLQPLVDNSHEFLFGFMRHGVFWGWPSSHTTVAFAVAVTMYFLYYEKPVIKYSAILIALYIGIGISTNIHWFSEFVAGSIIGSVIGTVVGNRYRAEFSLAR